MLATAWDIGPHTLLFHGRAQDTRKAKEVADTCWELWNWLGVTRPFTLVLWWREDPRVLQADEWPSRRTINGGWTSKNSSIVHVYRSEEWDRVFIHEMIHALGWDWKMPVAPLACWGLPAGSQLVPALFEAWTELYAEWLWCVWNAEEYGAWKAQQAWMEDQALQILARWRQQPNSPWSENTSVFAYYVLKAALAPYIDQLLLFGNGRTPEERERVLCRLAVPRLRDFSRRLRQVVPRTLSLRMTRPL